jgi:hypothetical protein
VYSGDWSVPGCSTSLFKAYSLSLFGKLDAVSIFPGYHSLSEFLMSTLYFKFPGFIPRPICVHLLDSLRDHGVTVKLKIFQLHPNHLPNAQARAPLLSQASA